MPTLTKNPDGTYTYAAPSTPPNPFPLNAPPTMSAPSLTETVSPYAITPRTIVPPPSTAGVVPAAPATDPAKTAEAPKPTVSSLTSRVDELFNTYSGKTGASASAVAGATAPFQQSLNELNTQLKLLQARSLENQEKVRQSGGDTSFQSGEAQRVGRNDAIEQLRLSALTEAMQGNLSTAETQAKNAVDAQFAQVESDLRTARQNILDNYDRFTPEEKRRADATLLRLDKDDAFVAEQKEARGVIEGLALMAVQSGLANTLTLRNIQNAKSPEEALEIAVKAGVFAPKPAAPNLQTVKLDNGETVIVDMNTGKTVRSLGGSKVDGASGSLLNLVQQYRDVVSKSNFFSANFSPTTRATLEGLKGQITAEYKKQQQLGTLDAGVQKLIDTIFPTSIGFGVVQFSPDAQVAAIDNFIQNQGGTPATAGKIRVRLSDGRTGTIDEAEFDPKTMTKL